MCLSKVNPAAYPSNLIPTKCKDESGEWTCDDCSFNDFGLCPIRTGTGGKR